MTATTAETRQTNTQRFDVLVNNGLRYEYEATIEAVSVSDARKKWKRRGDWKATDFKVRKRTF